MLRQMPIRDKNDVVTEVAIHVFRIVFQEKLRRVANSSQLPRGDRDLALFLAFAGFDLDERDFVAAFRDDIDFSAAQFIPMLQDAIPFAQQQQHRDKFSEISSKLSFAHF